MYNGDQTLTPQHPVRVSPTPPIQKLLKDEQQSSAWMLPTNILMKLRHKRGTKTGRSSPLNMLYISGLYLSMPKNIEIPGLIARQHGNMRRQRRVRASTEVRGAVTRSVSDDRTTHGVIVVAVSVKD